MTRPMPPSTACHETAGPRRLESRALFRLSIELHPILELGDTPAGAGSQFHFVDVAAETQFRPALCTFADCLLQRRARFSAREIERVLEGRG